VKPGIGVESNTNDVYDVRIFHSCNLKKRDEFGYLVEGKMKKLKWIFKKYVLRMWSALGWLRVKPNH
jgi:hypothetical protein